MSTNDQVNRRGLNRRTVLKGAAGAAAGASALPAALTQASTAMSATHARRMQNGEPIKLVYFNARGGEAAERALAERYMEENPKIEIEYLSTTAIGGPSDTDTIANLIFNIEAETTIDVAKVEVQRTPLELMATGSALELTEIGADAVQTRSDELLNTNTTSIKGGIWGLPYEYDPFGYIYNADMYREAGLDPDSPPKTWDEFSAANEALVEQFPGVWAICHPLKNLNKIQPLVWGAGGWYWNDTVPPTEANVTNQGAIDAYTFFDEWAQKGWLNTEEISTDQSVQHMVARQCGHQPQRLHRYSVLDQRPGHRLPRRGIPHQGRVVRAGELRGRERLGRPVDQRASGGGAELHAVAHERGDPAPQVRCGGRPGHQRAGPLRPGHADERSRRPGAFGGPTVGAGLGHVQPAHATGRRPISGLLASLRGVRLDAGAYRAD